MSSWTLIEKAFFLKKISFFKDLDLDVLLALADKMDDIQLEKDKTLFVKGQYPNHLYFLASGTLEISLDDTISPILLNFPGTAIGDEALFSEKPRAYTALTTTPCRLLALSRSLLFVLLSENPSVTFKFLSRYTKKLSCVHIDNASS